MTKYVLIHVALRSLKLAKCNAVLWAWEGGRNHLTELSIFDCCLIDDLLISKLSICVFVAVHFTPGNWDLLNAKNHLTLKCSVGDSALSLLDMRYFGREKSIDFMHASEFPSIEIYSPHIILPFFEHVLHRRHKLCRAPLVDIGSWGVLVKLSWWPLYIYIYICI